MGRGKNFKSWERIKNLQEGLRGIKDIKIFKKENEFQKF